jgi:hypothetical protein
MRDRRDLWKWPFSLGLAAVLTCVLFFYVPVGWLTLFFRDPRPDQIGTGRSPARWMVLVPPPEIEPLAEDLSDTESRDEEPLAPAPALDARWWTEGWQVQTVTAVKRDLKAVVDPADSCRVLLQALDLGEDFLTQTRPDSVLAHRLALLRVSDSLRFDELKPYLQAMTRARAYADIRSRAADMYDDHLQAEIMVPD